jgi:hypothetical protein
MMRRETKRFKVTIILVLALLSVSGVGTRAQSSSIHGAPAVEESATGNARPSLPTTLRQIPQKKPCNAKRRAFVGAAVGSVIAMVAVRKAAEANDGTIGAKVKLQAGGYGAALGALVGLKTCP